MLKNKIALLCCIWCAVQGISGAEKSLAATSSEYVAVPPFISSGAPPLVMLVMGRDHKLYYEAYNDASDLNDDGILDIRYTPSIDYYGYFDSYKCYEYSSTATPAPRFNPTSETADKTCDGTKWSGDYLNYLTMSRMDTMRKVLYGGYRSTDSTTETVLQRVYVPQDAHSWGKEYTSIAVDKYDIAKYTPFTVPAAGLNLHHLFASTTLSDNGAPILRYALNNSHRIWDWVAKERPVIDDSIVSSGIGYPGHPTNHTTFQTMVNNYATTGNSMGTGSWLNYNVRNHLSQRFPSPNSTTFGAIDGEGNPYRPGYGYPATDPRNDGAADQNQYLSIFTGTLHVENGGTYQFGVDGDDAVEVIIDGGKVGQEAFVGYYGSHGANGLTGGVPNNKITISNLSAGDHSIEFRMEENDGQDSYYLYWKGPDSGNLEPWQIIPNTKFKDLILSTYKLTLPASTITNLDVRVKVCDPTVGLETSCKQYPDGQYKPIGLLQRHGEAKRMYFGLMTGSNAKNTSGGVLRKRVSDISDEIITNTGQFDPSVNGIIQTLNKLRIIGFNYGDHSYNDNCGWNSTHPMLEGECRPWGNPIAEMMYETLRYFSGAKLATPAYDYTLNTTKDDDSKLFSPQLPSPYNTVGLPKATWNDPYDKNDGGFESCSRPFMLVLSDINPSYDSDQLPGAYPAFNGTPAFTGTLGTLNVENLANFISNNEESISGNRYIGQSKANVDSVCSVKEVDGLGDIRGLCPEEPTKMGSYYSASVAYYGHKTDLRPGNLFPFDQKVMTYSVGLASPLPRIELSLGPDEKKITLVPFGKTVASEGDTTPKTFAPTNTIVDFFVDTITPTYGKFRINYEDVEQGADHDMDAIVIYEYQLIDKNSNNVSDPADATQVKITLTSEYAAGSFIQHLGYIISGTKNDGPYLEVRDLDTSEAEDVVYSFDTLPPGSPVGTKLPLQASRTFTPAENASATSVAQLLQNPLWYAAKWGAFDDKNNNGILDPEDEWDKDHDGIPDTYFYVTNPLRLEEQLNKSFASILNQASSGTAASVISNTRSGEGAVYQSIFYPTITDSTANANTVSWVGQVHSFLVDAYGNMREDTHANDKLDVKGPDLNGNGRVYHEDINMNCTLDYQTIDTDGNGVLDTEDTNGNGVLDTEFPGACAASDDAFLSQLDAIIRYDDNAQPHRYYDVNGDGILQDREIIWNVADAVTSTHPLNYLWSSSEWLNSINDIDIVAQRSTYISAEKRRYIFTWVDGNSDKVVNAATEIKDFSWPLTPPALADLAVTTNFYPYLHLYPSFGNKPAAISALSTADFADFLVKETKREVLYIRGLDDVDAKGLAQPLNIGGSDIAGTELRSRYYNGQTWRLGDIAYSTPTVVSKPSEGYHLLYRDNSYADFAAQYADRRTVIYTGANDGMLHAFNGGFYDSYNKEFCRQINPGYDPYDGVSGNDDGCKTNTSMPELGAELWAYIPFNLLPHLHWLTESEYGHVYYVDQKPRIFDAKIFPADAVGGLHPNGWGTVMVVGMRFGGASIKADIDKTVTTDDLTDPVMKSAFLIFDITDPEVKPTLLGEITMPEMGFSTSYPTMVVMKDGDHNGTFDDYNDLKPATGENRWFLAFGSGPADGSGDPAPSVLATAASSQSAKFYMLDMVKLASKNEIWTLTDGTSRHGVLTQGLHWYSELDINSFVSDPITVDYNLDYNADVLYYGTVSTGTSRWEGKMRRIIIDDLFDSDEDQDPSFWQPDSVLFNSEQPITAGATVALDDEGRNWVFLGTGRYFVPLDGADLSLQSYYGIKEPVVSTKPEQRSWDTVKKSDLVNTSKYRVFTDSAKTVDRGGFSATWSDVVAEQRLNDGWLIDFVDDAGNQVGERNLGQAVLLGGALTFTTFIPSADVCEAGGESWLWAQYYKTGTAYFDAILGTDDVTFAGESLGHSRRKVSLGKGLATSPNVHVGSESGSKAFVQTSTGAIQVIDQSNPFEVKSGMRSWKESD